MYMGRQEPTRGWWGYWDGSDIGPYLKKNDVRYVDTICLGTD